MNDDLEPIIEDSQMDRLAQGGANLLDLLVTGAVSPGAVVMMAYNRAVAGRERRRRLLLAAMTTAVGQIKHRLDDGEFVRSEEFESVTEQILEKAGRRRELDKRDYYAAAFANSMLPSRPPEAERDRLIDTLERLRPSHLWLLAALLRDYDWNEEGNGPLGPGLENQFKAAWPEADWAAVQRDWKDLEAADLVVGIASGLLSGGDGDRNFRQRVTDWGKLFHQFVTLPPGDTHPPT